MVMPSRGPEGVSPQKYCDRSCYEKGRQQRIVERRATGTCRIYDMSDVEFKARLAAQNGCCAICSKAIEGKHIHRDHCHQSGEWRGLLCGSCNLGLGMFADDVDLLFRAIDYLKNGGAPFEEKN